MFWAGWKLVGILPLAVSLQILFLGRKMLFPKWVDGLKSAAIAVAVVLIPLSVLVFNPFATSEAKLEAQKVLWETGAPQGYEFTVQVSGNVDPEALSPKRILMEDDRVVSMSYAWSSPTHTAGDPAPIENLWTLDRAFSEVLAAKQRGWSVSATFEEQWGFIDRAFVEPNRSSSGWCLEVSEFAVSSE